MILYLRGISIHAVVVFGLGKNLLFKYILGHCVGRKTKSKSNDCSEYSLTQEKNGMQIESKLMVIRKH